MKEQVGKTLPIATPLVKFWRIKVEFSDRLFKVANDKFWETIEWPLLLNASRSESFLLMVSY